MRRPPIVVFAAALLFSVSAISLARHAASAQTIHANVGDPLSGESFASNPDAAIESARKRVAKGDLSGALGTLSQYVAAHPRELAPARYLGDLYYRKGDFAAAERTFLGVLNFAPGDAETHDRLGGIYAAQDRIAEAIAQFQRSLPESTAYGHLVELHRRLGDLDRYERQARSTADNDSENAATQYAMGVIYRAERKFELAVTYLERALALNRTSCPTLTELGTAYADLGNVDEAEKHMLRCLALEPNNYAASVNLGTVYVLRGRDQDAQDAFERANRLRPDAPEALVDIGYIADVRHNWDLAVSYYLRAIASDPLARDAYVDLGYDYGQHRLFALAEAAYLKGLSVAPGDGRLHYLLGAAYAVQGKRELARVEYRAASSSDDPEVARAAMRDLMTL